MFFSLGIPASPQPQVDASKIRDFNQLSSFVAWYQKPFLVSNFLDFSKPVLEWDVNCTLALDWHLSLFQVTASKYYLGLGYLGSSGVVELFFDESESTDLVIVPNPAIVYVSFNLDLRGASSGGGSAFDSNQILIIQ